jgi:hypothetical protein
MATNKAKSLVAPAKKTAPAKTAPAKTRVSLNPQAMIAGVDPGFTPTESGEKVTVLIPKPITLTLDDHTQVSYGAGIDEMPIEHANHWWSVQNGVEIYDPKSK